MRVLVALLAVATVNAFAPQANTMSSRQVSTTTTALNAYVPDGLSASEWAKKQADEKAKQDANKKKFPKGKAFISMGKWLETLEGKQSFKGEKFSGSGHTYAKNKFSSKEEYDASKGKK
ncbi:hypothetical protein CTAYLR_008567 [Chrysophaeum taylorii]|uniref:Uncharacterized protein n=1 Tax=Chrysophaeum taylorii TaxID=2483200 RepID=A0AAD7XIA0_9STRA|nr:hypothetical protein CTAYLR_008567 [Chrysophaeum taylorii]